MNKWPLFLLIFLSSSLNAGWANYWHSIKHTLKSVFSYQYVVRKQLIADLNSCNQLLKADIDAQREQRRKEANDALAAEIKKQGISNFFTQSKPSFSTIGIFNTSEAAFLLNEIKSKITTDKQKLAELQSSESNEDSRISKSEKRPSIRDMRELMELGSYEHNSNMSKSALYFKVSSTMNNLAQIQISLVERILAAKRMQNRQTGLIEDVPVTKKQVKIMVIGTEQENGTFSWEKITNDISAQDGSPKEPARLQFDDNKSTGSLEHLRFKLPKLVNSHPALKR